MSLPTPDTRRLRLARSGGDASSRRPLMTLLTAPLMALLMVLSACGDSADTTDDSEQNSEENGEDTPSAADDEETADSGDTRDSGSGDAPTAEGAVADIGELASSESTACGFDELIPLPVRPNCFSVSVPENWDDPDPDDQVVLQVAVFEGDGSHDDPYIYLDGGPGGETLDVLSLTFADLVQPLVGERDFIVFDQRGVGNTEPSLDCPELREVSYEQIQGNIADEDVAEVTADAQQACVDRLQSSGVDLAQYNSIASANDVEAIRVALGYRQLNPIGVSYGTRLGQTYMRLYPDSIRSIVLDSVLPTAANLWTTIGPGAERAFEQLFDGCEASDACSETYPNFEEDFFTLLDQLDAEPHQATVSNLLTGTTFEGPLDGDDVMTLVFQALYSRDLFSLVPAMTEDALNGSFNSVELLASTAVTQLDFVAAGQQLSVECNEEIPFESASEREANISSDPRYERLEVLAGPPTIFESCETWPSGAAPEVENETVESDIPTLLMAGSYDPITPPAGMDTIAAGLSMSYQVTLPHEGHGMVASACGSEIVASFVDDPTTEPDMSCVADSPAPAFAPGSQESAAITLVEFSSDGLINISGVRPEGWTEAGPGVFARAVTVADPTVVLIQPSQGQSPDRLANLIGSQTGLELTADGTVTIDGQDWVAFSATADDGTQAEMVALEGANGVVALLVAPEEEFDALREQVLLPMAAAAET